MEYTETISPVCLVPDCLNDDDEQEVTAMGWGKTKFEGNTSDVLRSAGFTTVPNDKCQESYSEEMIDSSQFCAYTEGKGPCKV